jgi:hypothetical protein
MSTASVLAICVVSLLVSEMPVIASAQTPPTPPNSAALGFEAETKPPPPDYADSASWAARPAVHAHPVDVFYLQPTTYLGPAWNQDVRDRTANALTDSTVLRTQATAFSECCDLYAPRYRQASSLAFRDMKGDGAKAYDLAYQDTLRAFDYYLKHDNHGRPFILAGHSQGALHVARLLEEVIDGKPERGRLVAAYVVGIGVSTGLFGKAYKTIGICRRPDDTGCVVSWNSFVSGSDVAGYVARSESRYVDRFGDDPGKALLCVNPLTFALDRPDGEAALHRGAVSDAASISAPRSGLVSASCRGGILFVDPGENGGFLKPLPGGSLHFQDVELFYANIRENAALRTRAWLAGAKR